MPKGTYPPFNEEYYTMLAKQQIGKKFSLESWLVWACGLCANPITLIFGIFLFMLSLLWWCISKPLAISANRRLAYKLYVEDCEKIKAQRRHEDEL